MGVGVGVGAGAGGVTTTILPSPGDATSSAPHAASGMAALNMSKVRVRNMKKNPFDRELGVTNRQAGASGLRDGPYGVYVIP